MISFQILVNTFYLLHTFTTLAVPADCTEGSCLSTIVIFDNFVASYFPFSQVQTIISSSFFLKLVIIIPLFFILEPISRGFAID